MSGLTLGLVGCAEGGDVEVILSGADASGGAVSLSLSGYDGARARSSDAPIDDVAHIWVTFESVTVRGDGGGDDTGDDGEGGWQVVSEETNTVDLLELADGTPAGMGSARLSAGEYSEIRLLISDAEVEGTDGSVEPATVPSGESSGLKIKGGFEIRPQQITSLDLAVDVDSSLSWNQGSGYRLDPVIQLEGVDYIHRAETD